MFDYLVKEPFRMFFRLYNKLPFGKLKIIIFNIIIFMAGFCPSYYLLRQYNVLRYINIKTILLQIIFLFIILTIYGIYKYKASYLIISLFILFLPLYRIKHFNFNIELMPLSVYLNGYIVMGILYMISFISFFLEIAFKKGREFNAKKVQQRNS